MDQRGLQWPKVIEQGGRGERGAAGPDAEDHGHEGQEGRHFDETLEAGVAREEQESPHGCEANVPPEPVR